ncbi:MAG: SPOR domain-containing protein [Oligoflexia bacterium]|nr:SPOR domain-containing protein [Oligoflexia bacterium]
MSFSIGTFVGKQFSDSQHKITELETADSAERSAASIPDTTAEPNQIISEDEIAKLSEEFVKKEKQELEKAPDSATAGNDIVNPKSKKPGSASIRDEISNVAQRLAAGEKIEAKKEKRFPANLPKELADSPVGKFTVQVSSQSNETEADRTAEKFKSMGFSAFVVPAEVNGKTWYRVSVGKFDDRNTALKYREKLMKEANLESAIIQKIGK